MKKLSLYFFIVAKCNEIQRQDSTCSRATYLKREIVVLNSHREKQYVFFSLSFISFITQYNVTQKILTSSVGWISMSFNTYAFEQYLW